MSRIDLIDYELPRERIAQEPVEPRDAARLLVLERETGALHHARVRDLPAWLEGGDLLVRNATRVLAARLRGRKSTGGAVEALLLGTDADEPGRAYRALVRAGGRLRPGRKLLFAGAGLELGAEIAAVHEDGSATVVFAEGVSPYALGEAPLPPYIRRRVPRAEDADRYQTVFARVPGSVAAPTAGLHVTPALLGRLSEQGIGWVDVVLHVGAGTFRPLRGVDLERGRLHAERYALPSETADAVNRTRAAGRRCVALGTTTTRVLEHCADEAGGLRASLGETDLMLRPGARFRVVDALLTNFHLPRSSLLLLVAAFAGREQILRAYEEAVREGYRFYSYGDAMLIL